LGGEGKISVTFYHFIFSNLKTRTGKYNSFCRGKKKKLGKRKNLEGQKAGGRVRYSSKRVPFTRGSRPLRTDVEP